MPKSVCGKCEVELRPETNGVVVVEMFSNNEEIYKLWDADLWKCPECGIEVVLGFGGMPFMHHVDGDTKSKLEELRNEGRKIIFDYERR